MVFYISNNHMNFTSYNRNIYIDKLLNNNEWGEMGIRWRERLMSYILSFVFINSEIS